MYGLKLSGLFTYPNTFKIVWEQRGLDNQGSTVMIIEDRVTIVLYCRVY